MLKNKLFITAIITYIITAVPVCAEELSNVEFPKAPAYRVGISSTPEKQYIEALQEKIKPEKKYAQIDNSQEPSIADMTYADLGIKRISKEISQELEFEEQDMVADLSLLWQGAAVQSDTINFALYKLANPDADKPDSKSIKKVLTTIASMSTLVGASMSSPVFAGSSLIGGNILGIMSQDTKALNYKYTKVGDADMIILIRKVEDLQQKAVNLYYDYMSSKKQLEFANKLVEERGNKFKLAQQNNAPRELVVITDAYYRTALDKQRNAKSEFFSKRAALEQFVGNETFVQFEQELAARENGDKSIEVQKTVSEEEQNKYNNTVKQTKEYTNSVNESSSVYTDEEGSLDDSANLALVSDLQPIEAEDSYDVMTGSSSNVENSTKDKKRLFKKSKKEDSETSVSDEGAVKKGKKKDDKYSTKGLIFLHNNEDKSSVQEKSEVDVNTNPKNKKTKTQTKTQARSNNNQNKNQYQQQNDSYNFAPLDDIKVPDLTPGGYSIHGAY